MLERMNPLNIDAAMRERKDFPPFSSIANIPKKTKLTFTPS